MQLQSSLVKNAFTASIPVCMGYIPLGIVFGFLCVQAGASWWIPPISSVLIYGGAVQYMMIPMLAADMSVASIAFATAVVNLFIRSSSFRRLEKMADCLFADR